MNNTPKLPKHAFTKPSITSIVLFIIILLVLVPNTIEFYTNKAGIQGKILIYLSPLVIPEVFFAYHTGIAISKIAYMKWHKGIVVPLFIVIIIHLVCIALCIGIESGFAKYPIKTCFDICQELTITDAILSYSIFSTVLFLPTYFALLRYEGWRLRFNNKTEV